MPDAVFIVGNSRSGTTLMSRIVGRHPDAFRFRELHFFDRFWTSGKANALLPTADAERVARTLCERQRGGPAGCDAEARSVVAPMEPDGRTAIGVLRAFLRHVTAQRGKRVPVEQTGRNVFYIAEILAAFPDARIVDVVRDPRDVLLSQKRKWRSHRYDKSARLMFQEVTNYHPIATSRLWAAAVSAGDRGATDPRVLVVRFEELLRDPERIVRGILEHCGLRFDPRVLDVPQVGSSTVRNRPDVKGIDASRAGTWQRGGLNATEVWLCERICGKAMERHGYARSGARPSPFLLLYYIVSLPIKTGIAVLNNARAMGSARQAVERRLRA